MRNDSHKKAFELFRAFACTIPAALSFLPLCLISAGLARYFVPAFALLGLGLFTTAVYGYGGIQQLQRGLLLLEIAALILLLSLYI